MVTLVCVPAVAAVALTPIVLLLRRALEAAVALTENTIVLLHLPINSSRSSAGWPLLTSAPKKKCVLFVWSLSNRVLI